MAAKKILVAYDGSEASQKALNIMLTIAEEYPEVDVVLVHVLRILSTGGVASGIDTVAFDAAQPIITELETIAESLPNNVEVKLLKGTSPADLIVNCAAETGADLIIMGSRGVGGVKGYLGSVSYGVVKNSPVTVMIAKVHNGE